MGEAFDMVYRCPRTSRTGGYTPREYVRAHVVKCTIRCVRSCATLRGTIEVRPTLPNDRSGHDYVLDRSYYCNCRNANIVNMTDPK